MKLANPEALAQDLETGLGELGWYYELISPNQRLHLPVSGIVSLAIASTLREAGHRVGVVQTHPQLSFCPDETHVFPVVDPDSLSPTIIDATYGSMLRFAGLTPEAIMHGQHDDYPIDKILTFKQGDTDRPASILTLKAAQALESWQPSPVRPSLEPSLRNMGMRAMYHAYSEFWNPLNFKEFTPSSSVAGAAQYLCEYIQKTSVSMEEY
jgi:hypothetical protein